MTTVKFLPATIALTVLLLGCTSGIIYTHTWEPLTLDMHRTKVVTTGGQGDIKHFSYSYVNIEWDSNAIGDIARKHGLHELYFADLETFSILRIWNQYTVHVYGK